MKNTVGARGSTSRAFAAEWLRDPRGIGSLVPSSPALGAAMASQVSRIADGTILELGPGTGAITIALLEAGIAPDRLYLVERNSQLVTRLRRRFPELRVAEGNAARLRALVERDGIEGVAAIVSGLPLRVIDRRSCHRILRQAFGILGDHGSFFQFTYHRSPMPRSMVERLGLVAQKVDQVWLNLPPASIWRFRLAPPQRTDQGQLAPRAVAGRLAARGAERLSAPSHARQGRG
jgi:phosphatidylethanolamine/phosphatidyl-N-methylethanolamine N-methyltransferase